MNVYSLADSHTDVVPVGTILPYMGGTLPPYFLWCDGTTFDISKYQILYSILGTNITPNLRGRTIFGRNPANAEFANVSTQGGRIMAALDVNHLPTHTHTFTLATSGNHIHTNSNHDGHTHGIHGGGDHNHTYTSCRNRDDGNEGNRATGVEDGGTTSNSGNHGHGMDTAGAHGHTINAGGDHTHTLTIDNAGSSTAFSILPPYYTVNYIIKARSSR